MSFVATLRKLLVKYKIELDEISYLLRPEAPDDYIRQSQNEELSYSEKSVGLSLLVVASP